MTTVDAVEVRAILTQGRVLTFLPKARGRRGRV
jgi:hypothetical protein